VTVRGGRKGRGGFRLLLLGLVLGGAAVYLVLRMTEAPRTVLAPVPANPPAKATPAPAPSKPHPAGVPADFEEAGGEGHGALALVLDDLGNSEAVLDRLATLPGPIALAALPGGPATASVAALAKRQGWDLLIHLPMSAGAGRPEPGEISPADDERTIEAALARAVERTPGAVGVNNHQGSAAMADRRVVRTVLRAVRDRHLFFLDSRTGASSIAAEEARALGTPILSRDVFLDAEGEKGLAVAWGEATLLAAKRGSAIVLAHPHPATLDFLSRELPKLSSRGLKLVKVSELVD